MAGRPASEAKRQDDLEKSETDVFIVDNLITLASSVCES